MLTGVRSTCVRGFGSCRAAAGEQAPQRKSLHHTPDAGVPGVVSGVVNALEHEVEVAAVAVGAIEDVQLRLQRRDSHVRRRDAWQSVDVAHRTRDDRAPDGCSFDSAQQDMLWVRVEVEDNEACGLPAAWVA